MKLSPVVFLGNLAWAAKQKNCTEDSQWLLQIQDDNISEQSTVGTNKIPIGLPDSMNQYLRLSTNNIPTSKKYWHPPAIATPHEKAIAFVNSLTLEEKVGFTTGVGRSRCSGLTHPLPEHGFDGICLLDGPAGVRGADLITGFVPQLTLGATWDRDLVRRHHAAMADEFRGKGVHLMLGPVTGGPLGRSAFDGRYFENWGGDPVLAGELSYVAVQAIQDRGVQACSKHFIGNEQETYRNPFAFSERMFLEPYSKFPPHTQMPIDSIISNRALHEVYTWPFADAVRAGTASVMCSYNRINGTPGCADSYTLNHVLKEELGFQGYIVSDWGATYSTEQAIKGGLDMSMPGNEVSVITGELWGSTLVEMVENGTVSENRLDDAVLRILSPYFELGQDNNYPAVNFDIRTALSEVDGVIVNEHVNVQNGHRKLVKEAGEGAITLLKNVDNALPLGEVSRLAVFGSDAADGQFGANCPEFFGCPADAYNNGTLTTGSGSGSTTNAYIVTPQSAIVNRIREWDGSVSSVLDDYAYKNPVSSGFNKVADGAETAIVFVNMAAGETWDRENLFLDHDGDELILQVASRVKNTIVVMHLPNPVIVAKWIDHPNVTAVLNAFLPGQESGESLVSVLFGDVSPSGKLPYTIAKNESDYIRPTTDAVIDPRCEFDDELLLDYRRFDALKIEPQFEFGFGLSYSKFKYSDVKVTAGNSTLPSDNAYSRGQPAFPSTADTWLYDTLYTVSFDIVNVGKVTASETSQLYVSYPQSAGEPPKVLRGFDKAKSIAPGTRAHVSIPLSRKSFSIWDVETQNWTIPKGTYTIGIGASSRDIRLKTTIKI